MTQQDCLKKIRYKLGKTQREFAELLNISNASVALYETGDRVPSFRTVRKIVKTLAKHNIHIQFTDLRDC